MVHQHPMHSYMEHGFCFSWEPGLVWLHVVSDVLTGIAYYSIPVAMFYFAYRRRDLPFYLIFVLFATFILSCGTTHFLAAYTVFTPAYWLEGWVKSATALISVYSAVKFIPRLPELLAMPNLSEALAENRKLNAKLEVKLAELGEAARTLAQANEELSASESRFRAIFDFSCEAIFLHDEHGDLLDVNRTTCQMYGYDRDELFRLSIGELSSGIPPCTELEAQGWIRKVVEEGRAQTFEWQARHKSGRLFWAEVSMTVALVGAEKRIIVTVRDISDRKHADHSLRQAKRYTEEIIQTANAFIVGLDTEGRVTLLNRAGEEISGYRFEELKGKKWLETMVTPEVAVQLGEVLGDVSRGGGGTFENPIITRDGGKKTISWRNSRLVEDGEFVGTISFGIDITEHRRLEEQLRQSLKMESIGRLAGGVAHDFNNKLSVIMGYAELAQLSLTPGSKLARDLAEISRAAEHSREITKQLLAFSRQQLISPKPLDLNASLEETQRTLGRLIGEDIILDFRLQPGLRMVHIDPAQLDQIVMNLAVNARDAMPDGGRLTIVTADAEIDEAYCAEYLDARPGSYVQLEFCDTGIGMDRETMRHIFEPFFTTKELGKGTGLGLSTIYGIVTQNKGFINVYSEPGEGTVFKIFLPALKGSAPQAQAPTARTATGMGRVLLVEDDEAVRRMTLGMLECMGYTAVSADSPLQALDLCRDPSVPLDFVLTDVIMPQMSGREMMEAMRKLRPGLKVLYMSGYTSEVIYQKGVIDQGMHFIQKPFDMNLLNEKIKQTLKAD